MKVVHLILLKLLSLAALAGGVLVAVTPVSVLYDSSAMRALDSTWIRIAIGLGVAVIGLLGLIPCRRRNKRKTISFPGTQGDVIIQLDSVEATLNRVIGRLPEVKKVAVRAVPSEDGRSVQITAEVLLYKRTGAGARETANRVSEAIAEAAENLLGVEEVTSVDLNVRGIVVDSSSQAAAFPEPDLPGPAVSESEVMEPEEDSMDSLQQSASIEPTWPDEVAVEPEEEEEDEEEQQNLAPPPPEEPNLPELERDEDDDFR